VNGCSPAAFMHTNSVSDVELASHWEIYRNCYRLGWTLNTGFMASHVGLSGWTEEHSAWARKRSSKLYIFTNYLLICIFYWHILWKIFNSVMIKCPTMPWLCGYTTL